MARFQMLSSLTNAEIGSSIGVPHTVNLACSTLSSSEASRYSVSALLRPVLTAIEPPTYDALDRLEPGIGVK
jgi:hypothetical protein